MPNSVYSYTNELASPLTETPYAKENALQELIAKNPHLLLRDNCPVNTLMLVSREYAVQISEDAGGSYSLDHLFLDRYGMPVLVEVKRSSDTRIKREVVAQMLDYAARARNWSVEEIKSLFLIENEGHVADEYRDDEAFWQNVETNLRAERLRLIFVADEIPDTLCTLIEFMDRSMPGIEVYGVEVKQYVNAGSTMLSVRIVEGAQSKERAASVRVEWNADTFASYLNNNGETEAEKAVSLLLEQLHDAAIPYRFGRGAKHPTLIISNGTRTICLVQPSSFDGVNLMSISFDLDWYSKNFSEPWSLDDIQGQLQKGFDVPGRRTSQYLYFGVSCLNRPSNMDGFINMLQWINTMVG